MTIIFYILPIVLMLVVGTLIIRNIKVCKNYGISYKQYKSLSRPSREILKMTLGISEKWKPEENIARQLLALDIAHGSAEATKHFQTYSPYEGTHFFNWKNCDNFAHRNCEFKVYKDIRYSIQYILNQQEQYEIAERRASIANELETASTLPERLNAQADSIKEKINGF